MTTTIENGYIYVDVNSKSSENNDTSFWVWLLVVFLFAIILFVLIWYNKFSYKIPLNFKSK